MDSYSLKHFKLEGNLKKRTHLFGSKSWELFFWLSSPQGAQTNFFGDSRYRRVGATTFGRNAKQPNGNLPKEISRNPRALNLAMT